MLDVSGLLSALALLLSTLTGGSPVPVTPPAAGGGAAAGLTGAAVSAAEATTDAALDAAIARAIARLTAGGTPATTAQPGAQAAAQAVVEAAAQAAGLDRLAILATTLSGEREVPGPGDPDGSGTATIVLLPDGRTLCYLLTASGIAPATAAHIHRGSPTEAGPVVVPLSPPTGGVAGGCVAIDPALHAAIRANPDAYYVNVHNEPYPAGAIRGQL